MKILLINGPNLNMLGKRETTIYGNQTFESYFETLQEKFDGTLEYFQSNIEGELINVIQSSTADGIVLNAGAYTHTSIALRDCISSIQIPVIEVHISNVAAREEFRHSSYLTPVCKGCIMGFGLASYQLAINYFTLP